MIELPINFYVTHNESISLRESKDDTAGKVMWIINSYKVRTTVSAKLDSVMMTTMTM